MSLHEENSVLRMNKLETLKVGGNSMKEAL